MEPHDGHRPTDADSGLRDVDAASSAVPDATTEPASPAALAAPQAAAAPGAPTAPTAPAPADEPSHAGNETVAAALRELAAVGQRPLAEHPDSFARVHSGLQQALSDIDDV